MMIMMMMVSLTGRPVNMEVGVDVVVASNQLVSAIGVVNSILLIELHLIFD